MNLNVLKARHEHDERAGFVPVDDEERSRLHACLDMIPVAESPVIATASICVASGATVFRLENSRSTEHGATYAITTQYGLVMVEIEDDAVNGFLEIKPGVPAHARTFVTPGMNAFHVSYAESTRHAEHTSHRKRLIQAQAFLRERERGVLFSGTRFDDPKAEESWKKLVADHRAISVRGVGGRIAYHFTYRDV